MIPQYPEVLVFYRFWLGALLAHFSVLCSSFFKYQIHLKRLHPILVAVLDTLGIVQDSTAGKIFSIRSLVTFYEFFP